MIIPLSIPLWTFFIKIESSLSLFNFWTFFRVFYQETQFFPRTKFCEKGQGDALSTRKAYSAPGVARVLQDFFKYNDIF